MIYFKEFVYFKNNSTDSKAINLSRFSAISVLSSTYYLASKQSIFSAHSPLFLFWSEI